METQEISEININDELLPSQIQLLNQVRCLDIVSELYNYEEDEEGHINQQHQQSDNRQPIEVDMIQQEIEQQEYDSYHCCVLDLSSANAKYQLVYLIVLIVQLIYEGKLPGVCMAWIGWYLLFGSCYTRENTAAVLVSQLIKFVIVCCGIYFWISQPLNMLVYLFLLLNIQSIVRIPVMLCSSCLLCVCASSLCFLCIKIKLEQKSKNEKRSKFLKQLKKKQKIMKIFQNSNIANKSQGKQFMSQITITTMTMSDQLNLNDSQLSNKNMENGSSLGSFDKQQQESVQNQCIICLQSFQTNYVQVDCRHKFHYECIKNWLQQKNTCPICRNELF